jgi:hypothetical protein
VGNLPGSAAGFTDNTVVLGAAYEYEVAASSSDGLTAYGYIYAGAEVPFSPNRGRVILVVDSTYASDLTAGLARLQADLVGDGWTVLRHDVPRAGSPNDVKSLLRADYNADPINTRAVFILGHVAVPYSGNINPDMHPAHIGAWPADVFYGDMTGTWTDSTVSSTSAEDPRNFNTPGDGKFDQSEIPGNVVLQVGRVDLSDLPAFGSRTELDLLRQYLDKDHNYRHRVFSAERRGLIRDNFGDINGDAPATDAWRAFAPLFGSDNIQVIGPGDFFPTLSGNSYLWAYGGGGGEYYQADGVGSTTDFAQQSPQAVFLMLHGSYFGDWDSTDNFLRASLASSGYGLAAAWTGLPHWYFHHMALGEPIGLSVLLAQNNRGLYKNQLNLSAGQVHIALMGDPTLRLHTVAPAGNLTTSGAANGPVTLNWTASADSVRGYYVYRADNPNGPFSRLTRSFLTTTSYSDAAAPPGPKVYMVRAVKLETSASGTYYNPSQGVFATVDPGSGPALPVLSIEALNPTAQEAGATEGDFIITRAGPSDTALRVDFTIGGSAVNGVDYETIAGSIVIPVGESSTWVPIKPVPDTLQEGDETVSLTLLQSAAYTIGANGAASLTIKDTPVNQPPHLSTIPDTATAVNVPTAPLAFTVADSETAPADLSVTASSSNTALVPNTNLVLGGSGSDRTLVVTPATGQAGTTVISVNVSDGSATTSTTFQLTVSPVQASGTIRSIARDGHGQTTLLFEGTVGQSYTVQVSKDFSAWNPVGSGVFTNGPATFVDMQSPDVVCRFYRIAVQ